MDYETLVTFQHGLHPLLKFIVSYQTPLSVLCLFGIVLAIMNLFEIITIRMTSHLYGGEEEVPTVSSVSSVSYVTSGLLLLALLTLFSAIGYSSERFDETVSRAYGVTEEKEVCLIPENWDDFSSRWVDVADYNQNNKDAVIPCLSAVEIGEHYALEHRRAWLKGDEKEIVPKEVKGASLHTTKGNVTEDDDLGDVVIQDAVAVNVDLSDLPHYRVTSRTVQLLESRIQATTKLERIGDDS